MISLGDCLVVISKYEIIILKVLIYEIGWGMFCV
jgi:hypothetical protein